jgi:uncharacterized membrane protein YagU involved in acid resistance
VKARTALRVLKWSTGPAARPLHRILTVASEDRHELGKGIVAGVAGGLIGSIVMTEFQRAWSKFSERGRPQGPPKEDASMKAAAKIAALAGRQLSYDSKKKLGPVVHYSFGTLQGALYGAAMEVSGQPGGLLSGAVFGSALFALADELAVPALGLSGKPKEYPLSSHLYGLASHLVYGLSSEIARRGVRASI